MATEARKVIIRAPALAVRLPGSLTLPTKSKTRRRCWLC